jgi:hypothetical protein
MDRFMYWFTVFWFWFSASACVTYFFLGEYGYSMYHGFLTMLNYWSVSQYKIFMVR